MSNAIKHTPGPWSISGTRSKMDCPLISSPSGFVAEVIGREEMRANAKLIVAAPDMVGVLENVLRWFRPRPGDQGKAGNEGKLVEQISAVLAKAGIS